MPRPIKYGLLTIAVALFGCAQEPIEENKDLDTGPPPIHETSTSGKEKETVVKLSTEEPHIFILGNAQDAGYPQAGCHKACCTATNEHSEKKRLATCMALVDPVSNESWMFEATPDFKTQLGWLQGYTGTTDLSLLNGIFLTHGHMGHYTGLMHLGREVMGANGVPVYAMPRMKEYLTNNGPWNQLVKLNNISLQDLQEGTTVTLNERLSVTPYLVPHRDEYTETVGFLIKGPEKSLLFIPDIDKWEKWDQSIIDAIHTYDILLLDGTFYNNGEIPGRDMSEIPHPFIEESMQQFSALSETDKKKVHFIHFNHTNPVIQMESDARKALVQKGFNVADQFQVLKL